MSERPSFLAIGKAPRRASRRIALALALACSISGPAAGQGGAEAVVLEDVVDIQIVGRELRGYVPGGAGAPLRLEQGERVWRSESRGRVGVVLTNRRFLGISPRSGGWRENPRRLSETADPLWRVAGRLALLTTRERALVFDSEAGDWLAEEIGPHEQVLAVGAAQSVAAVVTDRRAFAFLPGAPRFQEIKLRIGEELIELRTLADIARLRTAQRLLVFRGAAGSWSEETLPLTEAR